MALCSFCGNEIPKGTGSMLVKKDAKILWFCSRKCEKNMIVLGRKSRETMWTSEWHKAKRSPKAVEKPAPAEKKARPKKKVEQVSA